MASNLSVDSDTLRQGAARRRCKSCTARPPCRNVPVTSTLALTMSRWLFKIGLLCFGVPIVALLGISSMALMPGCTGGSSGPASGCYLLGMINLNWFVQLGVVAFVGSFFAIPIGLLLILLGGLVAAFSGNKQQ